MMAASRCQLLSGAAAAIVMQQAKGVLVRGLHMVKYKKQQRYAFQSHFVKSQHSAPKYTQQVTQNYSKVSSRCIESSGDSSIDSSMRLSASVGLQWILP